MIRTYTDKLLKTGPVYKYGQLLWMLKNTIWRMDAKY